MNKDIMKKLSFFMGIFCLVNSSFALHFAQAIDGERLNKKVRVQFDKHIATLSHATMGAAKMYNMNADKNKIITHLTVGEVVRGKKAIAQANSLLEKHPEAWSEEERVKLKKELRVKMEGIQALEAAQK